MSSWYIFDKKYYFSAASQYILTLYDKMAM